MPYKLKKKEEKLKSGPKSKLDTPIYQKAQEDIEKYLREGWLINEIYAEILSEIPELTEVTFANMVKKAYEQAKLTIHRNKEYIFKLHMDRYETIYKKAMEMLDSWMRPLDTKGNDWAIRVAKYGTAMKALKSKEDLLGLHNKDVVIDITEHTAFMNKKAETRGRPPFDTDSLSLEEQIELLHLLKQAKVSEDDGVRKLIVKKAPLAVIDKIPEPPKPGETIDTIYEEMPEKVVDKLQVVVQQEMEDESNRYIVDARSQEAKDATASTKEQVTKKINSSLIDEFKNRLKQK